MTAQPTAGPPSGRVPPDWGRPLTEEDYNALKASWVTRDLAEQAMLRRVEGPEARDVVGQKGKRDCDGVLFPYYWPEQASPFAYRVRRDHPEKVHARDGKPKEDNKYLAAPGSSNRLYMVPGITADQLADLQLPIALVEGEKKALALFRLASHQIAQPRFMPVGIAGVWNWRGTVGKTGGPQGERLPVKGPIADLDRIAWSGRLVYIIFDTNVQSNDSVKWARTELAKELATRGAVVKLVNLPEEDSVNGVDDLLFLRGPERVLELFDAAVNGSKLEIVQPPQFRHEPDGMFRVVVNGETLSRKQLSNFRAIIKTNIRLDDGVEEQREFEIEAELLGRQYRRIIPAAEFTAMDWPIKMMGSSAITYPAQKEYARIAIQWFSLTAEERCIYTHTGWRKLHGVWAYLHSRGAIGGLGVLDHVEVRLASTLAGCALQVPSSPDALIRAVRASLAFADLGPPSITFPLLCAVYRAVMGSADFAVHLTGETGTFKSELAAICQQHFGAGMDRTHLPGAWSSTVNSLEVLAFVAKDMLMVVDDFAPQGSATDVSRYHAAADRLFRAAGNGAGRGRLDSTATLREPKPPRALILSTGEEIPRGHSVRARLLIVEIAKGAIGSRGLGKCQDDARAGLYASAMGGFLQWIAQDYENTRSDFSLKVAEYRSEVFGPVAHARTPEIVSNLQAGIELFLAFAESCGAVTGEQRKNLSDRCCRALREAAAAQSKHHAATEPAAQFMATLRTLLTSGRAHLATRDGCHPEVAPGSCGWRQAGGNWLPQGDRIGWIDGESVYLDARAAYRLVQSAGRDSGEVLPVVETTLKKRLHEKNLLASIDKKRQTLTIRKRIEGASKDVLHFYRGTVLPDEPDADEACG